jgi:TRAP-type C4-dicarboxylate transport system substrate-binding protein
MVLRALAPFILALLALPAHAADPYVLKFATLAPEGTSWMNVIGDWAREVETRSKGRLKFRMYPGGVSGDEPDVLRKIRFGQLHGGAFTGHAIGEVFAPARVLEVPFLFEDTDEQEYVRRKLMPSIEAGVAKNGFLLAGWMEVGWIYMLSSQPVRTIADLRTRRVWLWQNDALGTAFFEASRVPPVPLSVMDVYTSLSTGLVDTVYCPPLACIALQWFSKTRYISDQAIANGIGMLLVSRKFADSLPPDLRKLLEETGRTAGERLLKETRLDNQRSIDVLQKQGIELVPAFRGDEQEMHAIAARAEEKLAASGYIPREWFAKVRALQQEYRSQSPRAPGNGASR